MVEDKAKNIQREKYIKILYLYLFVLHTSDKTKYNVITTNKLLIFFQTLRYFIHRVFSKKEIRNNNNLSRITISEYVVYTFTPLIFYQFIFFIVKREMLPKHYLPLNKIYHVATQRYKDPIEWSRTKKNHPSSSFVIIHPAYSHRIWFSSSVNVITSHVSVSRLASTEIFQWTNARAIIFHASPPPCARLPVLVRRMLVRQSPDNNIRVTHSLEYIFKLPFPVSGRGLSIVSASCNPVSNFAFDPGYRVPPRRRTQVVSSCFFSKSS